MTPLIFNPKCTFTQVSTCLRTIMLLWFFKKSCKCRASTLFQKFKFKTDNKATYHNEVKVSMKLYLILTLCFHVFSIFFKLAMLDRFEGSRWTAIQMQFQIGFELIVQTLISSKKSSNKVPPKLVANVWWLSLHKCQKPKGEKQQNKHENRDVPNLFLFRFFLFSFCWPFLWIYCAFTFNNLLFIYITLITWY